MCQNYIVTSEEICQMLALTLITQCRTFPSYYQIKQLEKFHVPVRVHVPFHVHVPPPHKHTETDAYRYGIVPKLQL